MLHGSLERTIREGLLQTAEYMDRCAAQAGHLIIFDRGAGKRWEDKIFRRDNAPMTGTGSRCGECEPPGDQNYVVVNSTDANSFSGARLETSRNSTPTTWSSSS